MYFRHSEDAGAGFAIDHSKDDESRFGEICAILSVGCALSTIAVALRCYTRLLHLGIFGLDDAIMLVAQVLAIMSAIAIGLESKYGLGEHTWLQPEEHFVPYMKSFYSSVIIYNVAMCLVKISMLIQYRRVFTVRRMQQATLYGIIFLCAWTITLIFLLTLICVPVAKFWDSAIPGRCLDSLLIWYIMAGFNMATDFGIFCLPLPVIGSLQLPRKQKIMLMSVFGLGLFTCIISIIRLRTLKVASSTHDPNWDNVDAALWSFLEETIAILAACLPTLRPIFARLMPRLFNSSRGGSHGQSNGEYISGINRTTVLTISRDKRATAPASEDIRTLKGYGAFELALQGSSRGFRSLSSSGGYSINITGQKPSVEDVPTDEQAIIRPKIDADIS